MSTARPFGRNTGSPLEGTAQFGDLCVGRVSPPYIRYDEEYGGIHWWNGADEEQGYIIGTDVPTEDWPSPIGNVGSVKFWSTLNFVESDFVNLANGITGQSFVDGNSARTWLLNNGYWTSFPGTGLSSYTSVGFAIPLPILTSQNAGFGFKYSPITKELYADNYTSNYGPTRVNTNTLTVIGELPVSGSSGSGPIALDLVNNRLYTGNVNLNEISKYDLNTNTIELVVEPYPNNNQRYKIAYNPIYNRLYITNDDQNILYILDGDNLSTVATINGSSMSSVGFVANVGVNTNNGNYIVTFDGLVNYPNSYDYFLYDGSNNTMIYSGKTNIVPASRVWADDGIPYCPKNDKFYLYAAGDNAGVPKSISVIDGTHGSLLTNLTFSGTTGGQNSSVIYDSLRNYIWTPSTNASTWVVIDCNTDTVVHQFTEIAPSGCNVGAYTGTYDVYNDRLLIGNGADYKAKYMDCNSILPFM